MKVDVRRKKYDKYIRKEKKGCCETTRKIMYSGTPLIRTLAIRIADYPEQLGPSGKHFLTVTVRAISLQAWTRGFQEV